jgi:two-component system, LytTR family, response regulator LytT
VLTIGICDDDPAELESLGELVGKYFLRKDLQFARKVYSRGEDLLSDIAKGQVFDVLFLDIYMGTMDGIEVARKVREIDEACSIIFATNSRSHAIKGYEVNAAHYLLKPITESKVAQALDRALDENAAKRDKSVFVHNRQGSYRLLLRDIVYAESDARVVVIHLRSGEELRYYDRLDNLESACGDERFLRCHKSFLVNLDYACSITGAKIELLSGEEIPITISVQKARELFALHAARGI